MSLWGSVLNFAGSNAGSLIGAAASIGGALIGSSANKEAASQAAEANTAAAQAQVAANEQAQQRFETLRQDTAPGMSYLRNVVATPATTLTPLQNQQMEDARRTTTNRLATSGLRGSGRATVAAFRGVEGDLRNRFVTANQGRSDSAAGQLASGYTGAIGNQATLDRASGQATAAGLTSTGLANAGSTLANGNLYGSALGTIGSIIASDNKARSSRYSGGAAADTPTLGTQTEVA